MSRLTLLRIRSIEFSIAGLAFLAAGVLSLRSDWELEGFRDEKTQVFLSSLLGAMGIGFVLAAAALGLVHRELAHLRSTIPAAATGRMSGRDVALSLLPDMAIAAAMALSLLLL